MNAKTQPRPRLIILLMVTAMLAGGCSNSNNPQSNTDVDAGTSEGENLIADDDSADGTNQTTEQALNSTASAEESANVISTRIEFNITVPQYQSNTLQVRVGWGEKDLAAMWVVDETWTVSDDFPTNTENQLSVTFSDNNGSTTLASFEKLFDTGSSATQTYNITAEQFDTERWDDDSDGISNLEESRAESNTNPSVSASAPSLLPVSASIELIADKTFRIRWSQDMGAQFYRVLENPDGVSGYSDVSGEIAAAAEFYDHRVALHKRVNARYIVEACNADGCVASAQQLIESTLEEAIGYFKASNTDAFDNFGSAVSVSADGKTMVVAADEENSTATGINGNQNDYSAPRAGAVYVFAYSANGWHQQAYIKASNSDAHDWFGSAISLSADGNTLAVGAYGEESAATGINGDQNDNSVPSAGAVYVFVRNGDDWQQQAYLKSSNNRGVDFVGWGDLFGFAVTLSADGDTLAVSATQEDSAGTGTQASQTQDDVPQTRNTGAVYVFQRSNNLWQQQAYIKADTNRSNANFGRATSISADGNTLLVSVYDPGPHGFATNGKQAPTNRGPDWTDFLGAVYVFTRTDESWKKQAFLRPAIDDWRDFGDEISVSADGNLFVANSVRGVEVFELTEGEWEFKVSLSPNNGQRAGGFGASISLSSDSSTLAIGAPREHRGATGIEGYQGDENPKRESGAVYVFTHSDGIWRQLSYVKASNSQAGIRFGSAVSLSASGDTMVVGASAEFNTTTGINGDQYDETTKAKDAGAVYLY